MTTTLLRPGNSKLGLRIDAWSLPAVVTCPGATDACRAACYAKKGHYHHPSVSNALSRNMAARDTPTFVTDVLASLRLRGSMAVRIHVAGDFDSVGYIQDWVKIVRRARNVSFLAYTRSWRVAELLPALMELAAQPRMSLWFSEDRDSGPAPTSPKTRRAYMAMDDADRPPAGVGMLFRVNRKSVMKSQDGVQVCLAETGIVGRHEHTCSTCRLCLFKEPINGGGPRAALLAAGRAPRG